jgi:hypothetical protein
MDSEYKYTTNFSCQDEEDILEFYRTGSHISDLSESYGISVYRLKKFLANEPKLQPLGYVWRSLFPSGKRP